MCVSGGRGGGGVREEGISYIPKSTNTPPFPISLNNFRQ